MKKLEIQENVLMGQIIFDGKTMKKDEVSSRINWLIINCLKKIAVDESGWDALYQDPDDKRYWELTFPNGEIHGGGAPRLGNVALGESVKSKYNI